VWYPKGHYNKSTELNRFGGPYFAFYNTPKPAWFKDSYGSHTPYTQAQQLEKMGKKRS
jgi:hypothetical protein